MWFEAWTAWYGSHRDRGSSHSDRGRPLTPPPTKQVLLLRAGDVATYRACREAIIWPRTIARGALLNCAVACQNAVAASRVPNDGSQPDSRLATSPIRGDIYGVYILRFQSDILRRGLRAIAM